MSLAMVAEDIGRKRALAVARNLVCYMMRPGGQSQFSTSLQLQDQHGTGQFDGLHTWVSSHLSDDLSVEALAERANMSPRNFARVYKKETGVSPARAVEAFRIEAARQSLEDTAMPLASVARVSGFGDDERLRRAMMRAINIAPGEYRARFSASTG